MPHGCNAGFFYFLKGVDRLKSALSGIKVLDLTRVLAGPFCTMILGDLGAEVIKVEAPGGSDETRGWGPPFQQNVSAYYLCTNRNKKSITLDLKRESGKEIIRRLAKNSDVVIHNFKTGTMERLGLGYETLRTLNPRLIYCSITGFGETGPYKDLPGYDFIIQAMSGLMSITGEENGPPLKTGVAITDVLTGLYACIGIEAALLAREHTGKGQKIDLSLYDSATTALVNIASNFLMSGNIPGRLGNRHPNIVPYQSFQTSDGEIAIAVGNDRQFQTLCELLDLGQLASDERFATNPKRVENRETLIPILEKVFRTRPVSFWREALEKRKIPCGPIQNLEQVAADPQLEAREMLIKMEHPIAGEIKLVASPLKLSETPVRYVQHPPMPGEHTEEILRRIGFSQEEIEAYKEE
ncbi:III protein, CoA-transferase family [Heyndrickxia coagulans]|uniref:III protein, CoA-transferase family n=1 Tax=Heyndrickxia coagulans TaxID=1398 RepID=A0A133KCV9_HEYCO|nr:III protein, CoA-transferase family [Heyndrickxia coagulans]